MLGVPKRCWEQTRKGMSQQKLQRLPTQSWFARWARAASAETGKRLARLHRKGEFLDPPWHFPQVKSDEATLRVHVHLAIVQDRVFSEVSRNHKQRLVVSHVRFEGRTKVEELLKKKAQHLVRLISVKFFDILPLWEEQDGVCQKARRRKRYFDLLQSNRAFQEFFGNLLWSLPLFHFCIVSQKCCGTVADLTLGGVGV
jgi:hypothetical protein